MVEDPRVLSVQSHVVSGYVGNKSAVFPMQLLGLEVDIINSVQFSNHTGYKAIKGQVLTERELAELVEGLSKNHLDFYTHLLTGYIGSPGFLKEIVNLVKQLKKVNPNLVYVCDPVLGDNDSLYVPKELIPIYKDSIVSLATILTPNKYEAEILTDTKITKVEDVWRAIDILHKKGTETVVISSAELVCDDSHICVFASSLKGTPVKLKVEIEKMPVNFTGTGDLFASLLLSWMQKTNGDLKDSIEKTVASLQAVLKRTYEYLKGKEVNPRNTELRLVQSKKDIEEPTIKYKAQIVKCVE